MAQRKTIPLPVPTDADPQAVREVTLHELRIGTILDLLERAKDGTGTDPLAELSGLLASGQVLSGLSLDDLKRLAPSDLGTLWEAFQEVNAAFLALLRTSGILDKAKGLFLDGMRRKIGAVSGGPVAAFSGPDMPMSGDTPGASSPSP